MSGAGVRARAFIRQHYDYSGLRSIRCRNVAGAVPSARHASVSVSRISATRRSSDPALRRASSHACRRRVAPSEPRAASTCRLVTRNNRWLRWKKNPLAFVSRRFCSKVRTLAAESRMDSITQSPSMRHVAPRADQAGSQALPANASSRITLVRPADCSSAQADCLPSCTPRSGSGNGSSAEAR